MQINAREADGIMILQMDGEIDINTSPEVRKAFEAMIKQQQKKILLNFSQVSYIDSSGLATLVEMLQRLKRYEGILRLSNLSDKVKALFEITKLDRLFSIFTQEDEALKDF